MAMVKKIKCLINGEIDAQLISINARKLVEKFDSSIIIKKWEDIISPVYKT